MGIELIELAETNLEDALSKVVDNMSKVGMMDNVDQALEQEELLQAVMGKLSKVNFEEEDGEDGDEVL